MHLAVITSAIFALQSFLVTASTELENTYLVDNQLFKNLAHPMASDLPLITSSMPNYHVRPIGKPIQISDTQFPDYFGDDEFDQVYPESIKRLSGCHWTPVEVGRKAAQFLVKKAGTKVLDVGCGPGKFCAVGAVTTEGNFTGVEQREYLVSAARSMLKSYRIPRVEILHANVAAVNFDAFDAFYFYNPFQENMFPSQCIDFQVQLAPSLYYTYSAYVRMQLSLAPKGTRAVTYWGNHDEIPPSYDCMGSHFDGKLKFWTKKRKNLMLAVAGKAISKV